MRPKQIVVIAFVAMIGCTRARVGDSKASATLGEGQVRTAADNTPEQNKELAHYLIRKNYPQWSSSGQIQCLESLWQKESHWNHRAVNKRTGACGIPQSYPCDKMAGFAEKYGVDHRGNPWPQIAWGLQYIDKRYKTPCAAWKRFRSGGGY